MESVELACDERPGMSWRFHVLRSAWSRLKGLLGTEPDANAVLLVRCASIHTFGMRYALDVAFIGRDGQVLSVRRGLVPGNAVSCAGAYCVAERPASGASWFERGEHVRMLGITVGENTGCASIERTCYECQ